MDSFPADFNLGSLQEIQRKKEAADGEVQKELLKKARQWIYNSYATYAQNGSKEMIIAVDELSSEGKATIAKELCRAFPGRVDYRWVVEYADVDQFEPIKNPDEPNISFEYRLRLKE
jgi:hypothetical protein